MSNIYKIQSIDDRKTHLILNPKAAVDLGVNRKKFVILSFGNIRLFADVALSEEVPQTQIRLSDKLITNLHLPDYLDFEVRVSHNELIIGPYIGMLMSKEDKRLTASFLDRMRIYTKAYEKIHGAIVIFALDKVDAIGRLVEGYCYNPVSKSFEKGIYPFPSSIYRTIGLSTYWKNCFASVLGDRVFNSHYFSKWDMYQWFSDNSDLSMSIPSTSIYETSDDVFDSLDRFKKIYIKPISGLGGHGITQVERDFDSYVFKYRENGENLSDLFNSKDKAEEFIKRRFSHGRYLIQQAIELIQYRYGILDFRCIMQKDQRSVWVCKAIIGRYGDRGSVVSNISSGGRAIKIDNMRRGFIPLPAEKVLHLDDKITSFCLKVCETLDEFGLNCGTLGLDIGVDTEGNLWLIEINNRDPDPSIALNVRDWPLYEELKAGLLFYAKSLAGFAKTEDQQTQD